MMCKCFIHIFHTYLCVLISLNRYYEELINAGVLAPLTTKVVGMKVTDEGTKHYVTPSGVSSIVKHFMKEADIDAK